MLVTVIRCDIPDCTAALEMPASRKETAKRAKRDGWIVYSRRQLCPLHARKRRAQRSLGAQTRAKLAGQRDAKRQAREWRNTRIRNMRSIGYGLREIGEQAGLTPERVRQILKSQ